jgi:hypothetical protein
MGVHYNKADFITYGKPSLFLDFANKKSLTDRISGNNLITFTRTSTGTYVDADGSIKTASANEPRFDHDPVTGESLGLLIEEQRTNLVDRSTATGATIGVLGSGGALPTGWAIDQVQPGTNLEIVNFGTEKGLNYIDLRFYGTTTTTNRWLVRPGSAFNITNGVTYSVSCYAKLISGSTAGNYLNYVGASLIGVNSNSNLTRYTRTFTATSTGTLYHRLDVGVNSIGTTYDLTIRFAAPQLEQGSFPTSYIPTSGSQVTRTADSAGITGTNFSSWFNTSQGTFFANYISTSPVNARILNFGTGATATIISNEGVMGSGLYFSSIGSISGSASNGVKVSATTSVSESAGSFDGNATVSTGACSYYAGATSLYFIPGTAPIKQNWIKQVRYYPTRLTNAQLQSITK